MSKKRHTEAQIIAALKQVEAGRRVEDVAREAGVSQHTIYAWKAKYGGMEVNEAQRLRSLEDENSRLKRLEEMRGRCGDRRSNHHRKTSAHAKLKPHIGLNM
jgi:putative transposase